IYTQDNTLNEEINTFNIFLTNAKKSALKIKKSDTGAIKLLLDETMNEEEYKIEISGKNLLIIGKKSGVFYGLMSVFQWMTQAADKQKLVLRNNIHDYPAYSWRGMHLDVSRHFFPTGFVKKYIDIMAMHKMNTFHWHLTDDQGWRIEIKKYPLLTAIGSKRKETMVDKHFDPYLGDHTPVEGFYTQDQIADVIRYAALRHVTVVPEIEMPGHAQAALAAYPQYSCNKKAVEVMTTWGVSEQVFCSDDKTITFMKDILDEVMALFPSKYIHIGGDEVPKTNWKACAVCQQNIKRLQLKDENELQSYFIRQMDDYVTAKGKNIIGWDEILEGGLAPNAAVMSWRGEEGAVAAAKQKHQAVLCPGSHCYFDHYQSDVTSKEPLAIGGFTPIEKVYAFDPQPKQLSDYEQEYVLGAQGNLWSEYLQVSTQVEYMAVPRISALAEVLWTGNNKPGFDNFKHRLHTHFNTLDRYQIYYAKTIFDVKAESSKQGEQTVVVLQSPFNEGKIYYTTDGNTPDKNSAVYVSGSPLKLSKNTLLQAQYYENGQPRGNMLSTEIKVQ
ncbi:MAG: family 20 glycosylhydrolase, partial [Chitinophagaceae bacterium]|nr:family 20 glycosylhydrolase [Chitinophagaceae bacterium]